MAAEQSHLSPEFIAKQRKRLEDLRKQVLGGELNVNARKRAFTEEHGDEAEEFEDSAQDLAQEEATADLALLPFCRGSPTWG